MTDFEKIKSVTDHIPTGLGIYERRKHEMTRDISENVTYRYKTIEINRWGGDYETSIIFEFDFDGNLTDLY